MGSRGRPTWLLASMNRHLLVSVESVTEVVAVTAHNRDRFPHAPDDAKALIGLLEVPSPRRYEEMIAEAAVTLRNAPASRNGSAADAHVLALAWIYGADIWSHDRDFAGTGWPSLSSANLADALSEEALASKSKD